MIAIEEAKDMTKKDIQIFIASSALILFSASLAFGAAVNLPQTGQKKCFDADGTPVSCVSVGAGQDGAIRAGVAWPNPRFVVGDDCATDNLTGLIWTTDANKFGVLDWNAAISAANGLNAASLCGCNDWRLPNMNELESLMHAGVNEEQCASTYCLSLNGWLIQMGFENVNGQYYWSSTTYASDTDFAWALAAGDGMVTYTFRKSTNQIYVWPVCGESSNLWRTGQSASYATGDDGDLKKGVAWPVPRFTVGTGAESDCVTDNLTGLMWTKDANRFGSKLWVDAISEANSQILCGHDDWRLPNRKELFSLIDRSKVYPAIPLGHPFSNVRVDNYYWSSTTYELQVKDHAWMEFMGTGVISNGVKNSATLYVWPVRSGGDVCATRPVKVGDTAAAYDYIQDAYTAAVSPETIRAREAALGEELKFAGNKIIILIGGYDCDYKTNPGFTAINSLTIGGTDKLTISSLIIR
jgi:hypothetical protein